jgi:large subunit ribosomal protein L17
MKKSLTLALLENDRIKTTQARAKEIRGEVDRVITWAKRGDVHSRRLAIKKVGDKDIVRELFEKVEKGMFANRPGGYTRIFKLGNRKGDNAPMVIIELVTETCVPKEKNTAVEVEPKGSDTAKAAAVAADDGADGAVELEAGSEDEASVEEVEETEEALEDSEDSVEEATVDEAPTDEAPSEEAPEAPADETPSDEAPAEETSTEEA